MVAEYVTPPQMSEGSTFMKGRGNPSIFLIFQIPGNSHIKEGVGGNQAFRTAAATTVSTWRKGRRDPI